MNFINLLGNMGPAEKEPQVAEQKEDKEEIVIRTITWCGCGNHPINPKKDRYKQHNIWMAQFHPFDENGQSDIRRVKGIGASKRKPKPTYDFSGEEFEVTNAELYKYNK
jgi:hypothetical protein